ncbi:hypothetical protein [Bdellovibrio bacteriovorus]|uniref:Uncharacterized protein n=1 Tax=Bdellovibrio bacteriovorus TaxID=959 RepID=A0A150WD20_BDEBC|nr:hypothetical protein [Bdellovibrio bacteriovorus]KYG60762.1 hypothetical protein AZI85_12295 [Bdellovibrio bacteriovorus]KYG69039.1 hypothetical protein AZI87_07380 [Bdellovibrio bacteriovorus]
MIRNALIAVYILVVLAISAVARAGVLPNNALGEDITSTELQNYNFKTHVGEIVALADGSLVLAMEDQQTFFVLKSQIELTPFVGSKVMVSGIELEHQLAPNFELETVDPLPSFGSGNKAVVFFVFGISEVR